MPNKPTDAELRALYDIRVKEAHHYNTLIWAFPGAYLVLLITEARWLEYGSYSLLASAVFNFSLAYVFTCHLLTKQAVISVLRFTEGELEAAYGKEYVPNFSHRWNHATFVMTCFVWGATLVFIGRAIYSLLPK